MSKLTSFWGALQAAKLAKKMRRKCLWLGTLAPRDVSRQIVHLFIDVRTLCKDARNKRHSLPTLTLTPTSWEWKEARESIRPQWHRSLAESQCATWMKDADSVVELVHCSFHRYISNLQDGSYSFVNHTLRCKSQGKWGRVPPCTLE